MKVFVIDDSKIVREGFKRILQSIDGVELLGEASNPIDALDVFKEVGLPDLFILDIEMPKMDGLTFLKKINDQRPTPVIICSSLVESNSNAMIDAMRLGAIDIIKKPKLTTIDFFQHYANELKQKIEAISKAKITYKKEIAKKRQIKKSVNTSTLSTKFVAIGSSTGGIQVLEEILTHLRASHVAIVIVQHIPSGFSSSLAKRLNDIAPNSIVKEIEDGDILLDGHVYIAPGGLHVEVEKVSLKYRLRLKEFEKVNSHRPSIDVFFNSVAKVCRSNCTGFILTGMGKDGALGLKMMRESGAMTYAQNEKTSTIFGMPKVALEIDAAKEALSIFEITKVINAIV